jgi:uncharacterized protein YrrD
LNDRVAAIICKEGTLKKNYQIIPYEKIISIDANGIVISDVKSIEKQPAKERNRFLQLDAVINKAVKSNYGELYGIITDIYINLLNGKITAYELSEGYIDDIVNGRRMINLKENLSATLVNKEIIINHTIQ